MGLTEFLYFEAALIVGVLVTVGIGVLALPRAYFGLARATFVVAATGFVGIGTMFALTTVEPFWIRALILGVLGAIGAVGATEGLRMVTQIQRTASETERPASTSERTEKLGDDIKSVSPLIEALRKSQGALAESEQTKTLLGRATSQFDQLETAIAARERFIGERQTEERLAAAEHIIKELRAILGNVQTQATPQGQALIIKTAPNTFRVTFPVPMRIPPALLFSKLPAGAQANVIENSKLGFTVIFTPPTIPVDHFGIAANAEL